MNLLAIILVLMTATAIVTPTEEPTSTIAPPSDCENADAYHKCLIEVVTSSPSDCYGEWYVT